MEALDLWVASRNSSLSSVVRVCYTAVDTLSYCYRNPRGVRQISGHDSEPIGSRPDCPANPTSSEHLEVQKSIRGSKFPHTPSRRPGKETTNANLLSIFKHTYHENYEKAQRWTDNSTRTQFS